MLYSFLLKQCGNYTSFQFCLLRIYRTLPYAMLACPTVEQ